MGLQNERWFNNCAPLAALLADATVEMRGDDRPVARAELGDKLHQVIVFLRLPRALHHSSSLGATTVMMVDHVIVIRRGLAAAGEGGAAGLHRRLRALASRLVQVHIIHNMCMQMRMCMHMRMCMCMCMYV